MPRNTLKKQAYMRQYCQDHAEAIRAQKRAWTLAHSERRICRHCQIPFPFLASPSALARGNRGQFCSRSCWYAWRATQEEHRFWEKVNRCHHEQWCLYCCWPWTKAVTKEGYGVFTPSNTRIKKKSRHIPAHRRAWEFLHKRVMPKALLGCHWCHNPTCVNPLHIYAGTHKANTQQSVQDKRFPVGNQHPAGKISDDDIATIRTLTKQGRTRLELARRFHVGTSTIQRVVHYRVGKHMP